MIKTQIFQELQVTIFQFCIKMDKIMNGLECPILVVSVI